MVPSPWSVLRRWGRLGLKRLLVTAARRIVYEVYSRRVSHGFVAASLLCPARLPRSLTIRRKMLQSKLHHLHKQTSNSSYINITGPSLLGFPVNWADDPTDSPNQTLASPHQNSHRARVQTL